MVDFAASAPEEHNVYSLVLLLAPRSSGAPCAASQLHAAPNGAGALINAEL